MGLLTRKKKVFCIGFNKTGTTTLNNVLAGLGYKMGDQAKAELLMKEWSQRKFNNIIKFVKSADAFQDIPFSLPFSYIALDQAFPNSRFILTLRESEEDWYRSIVRFHSKKWAKGKEMPSRQDLENAAYRYVGFANEYNQEVFSTPDERPYDKESLVQAYRRHNQNVLEYFKNRHEDLLVLNLSKEENMNRLEVFLGRPARNSRYPKLNASI